MNEQQQRNPRAAGPGEQLPPWLSEEFAYLISHELRTPLTSIIGFAEAMVQDPSLSAERYQEFAEIIAKEGKRLSQVVDLVVHQSISKEATAFTQQNQNLPGIADSFVPLP